MGILIVARLAAPFGMWETHSTMPMPDTPAPLGNLYQLWQAHPRRTGHPAVMEFVPEVLQGRPSGQLALVDLRRGVGQARYLWAGPSLVRLFGGPLAGRLLTQCYRGQVLAEVQAAYQRVLTEDGPIFSHRRFRVFKEKLGYHRLLLPLADEKGQPAYAMLMLAPKGSLNSAADWRPLEMELELLELLGAPTSQEGR